MKVNRDRVSLLRPQGRRRIFTAVDVGDGPTVDGVVAQARDTAGVEVKGAIIVEMSSRDAANDPHNRKVMADD